MNWRDLRVRIGALLAPRRVERELADELGFHLEMETRKHVAAGLSPEDARARAQARFGSATRVADECRDARGTAFIDTSARDIAYAFRGFRRAPTLALTIIGTVALGLGLVAAVFTIFNAFVFRVDAVRNPGELFAVERPRSGSAERIRFTRPQYEAMRRETDVFSDTFATLPDITSRIDGRVMEGTLVTGNFFQMLGVEAALGRTLVPADDERHAGRPVMVLSHRGWRRLFAGDPSIVGRPVVLNGLPYEIIGVTPEGFRGLGLFAPDYWAPLALIGQVRRQFAGGREDLAGIDIIGRLKPGVSERTALAGLVVWASGETGGETVDRRRANITLQSRRTAVTLSSSVLLGFSPLFFAFGLILMIGCANVANLLLARAVSRQREIGVRLSLGASRRRVVRQLLTESLLLALASAACALAVSRVVLDTTAVVITRTMPPELAEMFTLAPPGTDWRVAVFLVVVAIIATGLFGLVPALHATRLDPVRMVRGEFVKDARPSRGRNALIVVQVTASALLLICAGIFLRSALRASTFNPGWRTADNIIVDINNESFRPAMVAAVTADPSVRAVAASWPEPLGQPRAALASAGAEADTPATSPVRSRVSYRFASSEYFSVLDIGVVRGRVFTPSEAASNTAVVVVSETTAHQLWPNGDAVGQLLSLEADPDPETRRRNEPTLPSRSFVVVGIVRDVAGFRIVGYSEAGVYVPGSPAAAQTALIVRVHGDPELARRALLERLTAIDPNMGLVLTMRTLGRLETYPLQVAFWLTVVLGGLALVLTLTGIFSVLSYLVEQRTKEIGVRMALGATTWQVMRLVLWQSLRQVGVGLIVGGGLAWGLAAVLMSTRAALRLSSLVDLFDPLAYAASLLCIVTACILAALFPAHRAARIDPIAALRQD
jgi:predicted permease